MLRYFLVAIYQVTLATLCCFSMSLAPCSLASELLADIYFPSALAHCPAAGISPKCVLSVFSCEVSNFLISLSFSESSFSARSRSCRASASKCKTSNSPGHQFQNNNSVNYKNVLWHLLFKFEIYHISTKYSLESWLCFSAIFFISLPFSSILFDISSSRDVSWNCFNSSSAAVLSC